MQFQTVVVVPADTPDPVAEITRLMVPYDVEREVPARKEYVPQDEIDYLIEVYEPYGLKGYDIEAVVAQLAEDSGYACGHDDGGYWWMTTSNPQGQWDGWRLQSLQDDSWPATAALPEHIYPAAIVTPDGVWHDLEARWDMNDKQTQELRVRAAELLTQYLAHCAVVLHCHR